MKFDKTSEEWDKAYHNYLKHVKNNNIFPATKLQFYQVINDVNHFNYWFNYKEKPEKEYKFSKTKEEWEKAWLGFKNATNLPYTFEQFHDEVHSIYAFSHWLHEYEVQHAAVNVPQKKIRILNEK